MRWRERCGTIRDDNAVPGGAVWCHMRDRTWTRSSVLALATGIALTTIGTKLATPAPANAFVDKKAAGSELFANRGCAHCHGDDGQGTDRGPALRELRKKLNADRI